MATGTRPRIQTSPAFQRVRATVGGKAVADSSNVKLVWEIKWYPTFFFPIEDVDFDQLTSTDRVDHSPRKGDAQLFDLNANGEVRTDAARVYYETDVEDLKGHVAFKWDAIDAWYEEDEELLTHPKDPFTRVDILQSSRNVRIEIDGVTIADSSMPRMLIETKMPRRFYLPQTDVRMDLLTQTDLHTDCPYKGRASYWSVDVNGTTHENVVWGYPYPTAESAKIAGYVAFWDEKLDVYVDGVLQDKPKSIFS